jgi:predicted transposase/invertase (TIGR01784 family)
MLAPLDNETIFKKAFTDKEVFQQFVKDLFDIDIIVDKIETEKKFEPPISPINFELDIYAETTDHQFIIEIQKIDYDYNFDRFLHYFLTTISNQQKKSDEYKFTQRVLGIVVFSRPYRFETKNGLPIKDNVLIIDFNPRNLKGELVKIYEHNMVFLNASKKYQNSDTPKNYQDWLDLFYASMKEPVNYKLNLNNKGVAKVIDLINYDKLDGETLQKMKEDESRKVMEKLIERDSKIEGAKENTIEIAKNLKKLGISIEVIAQSTKLSIQEIENIDIID